MAQRALSYAQKTIKKCHSIAKVRLKKSKSVILVRRLRRFTQIIKALFFLTLRKSA